CYIDTGGNLNCTGSITGVAITPHQRKVEMYGIQATESWYEDAGSASLINGSAVVQLDSNFAGIANTGVGYQVFLTPNANCNGLYVANKTTRSFEVHELGGVMRAYRLIIGSWPNARAWKRTACAI